MVILISPKLGLCTPPVGSCLFKECADDGVRVEGTAKTIWPCCPAIPVALLLVRFVPAISRTLPILVGKLGSEREAMVLTTRF